MSVNLTEHIHEMTNCELNSIAKLRFTDKETQIELAKHKYLLCRKYLGYNPRLCAAARDILLAGKADSVKLILLQAGHLDDRPEKISELYFRLKRRGYWYYNLWAMLRFFVRPYGWDRLPEGPAQASNTPTNVLQDAYDQLNDGDTSHNPLNPVHIVSLLQHRNSTERMAVVASASTNEIVRRAGFDRLVEFRIKKNQKFNDA